MARIRFSTPVTEAEDLKSVIKWFNGEYKKDFAVVEVRELEIDLVFIECNSADIDYIFLLGSMYGREAQRRSSSQ